MNVLEVMTRTPATCTRETPLQEVARMMVDCNCGAIPVVDDDDHPIGILTDRDIVVRTIAQEEDPFAKTAGDVMTADRVITVTTDTSVDAAASLLEDNQIRRLIVCDDDDRVVGMVAQADLARRSESLGGEVVAAVSQPSVRPSAVH